MAVLQDIEGKDKIVILDGYNLIYRARYSARWQKKDAHTITYNFFRSLRRLIEDISPTKCYFVLEGVPKARLEAASDYKGTREYENDPLFSSQRREIISIMKHLMPFTVIQHPDYECDDVISHIATTMHSGDEVVIVSTDTDFIQLLNISDKISIYNPIKKNYVETPDFDYVTWKALRGDGADNIHGFKGIGDKTALKLVQNPDLLEEFLNKDQSRKEKFDHNIFMIKFHEVEQSGLKIFDSKFEDNSVRKLFEDFQFGSILKDKPWKKFVETFEALK